VSSANVASVSESGGPPPPVAPAPSPVGKWKGQDATLKKVGDLPSEGLLVIAMSCKVL